MDRYGNGEEIVLDKVFDSVTHTPSFRKFDMELFTGGSLWHSKFSFYVFLWIKELKRRIKSIN